MRASAVHRLPWDYPFVSDYPSWTHPVNDILSPRLKREGMLSLAREDASRQILSAFRKMNLESAAVKREANLIVLVAETKARLRRDIDAMFDAIVIE